MTAMSNYLENKLIDHLLRDTAFSAPAGMYVGLVGAYSASELEAGTLSGELSGGSYARVSVKGDSNWSAGSTNGQTDNENNISFTTATGDWGYVSGLFLADASSGGNVILYGTLTTPKIVENGDQFVIAAGDLDITFA
tara:strand:- start:145 stop:558 length:414 start_codon:yes stop_codon:yes gene_type:complete